MLFSVEDKDIPKSTKHGTGEDRLKHRVYADNYGNVKIDFRKSPFADNMLHAFGEVIGWSGARVYGGVYPLSLFIKHGENILNEMSCNFNDDDIEKFAVFIREEIEKHRVLVAEKIKSGKLEFYDLKYYFVEGEKVFGKYDKVHNIGGEILGVTQETTFTGYAYLKINICVYAAVSGKLSKQHTNLYIGEYNGFKNLNELPVKMLAEHPDIMEELVTRGKKIASVADGVHYRNYTGQITQRSWWSDRSYRADGRVMIDPKSLSQLEHNTYNDCMRSFNLQVVSNNRHSNDSIEETITDMEDVYYATFPYVMGFSFRAKTWGVLDISGISDIKWSDAAFDQLVLPAEQKQLVRTLVKNSNNTFTDIVADKGGGCIFMLHGSPGQGKTLTAEAVAELLRRPLYSVSIGELGTNPDVLENRLRQILDIATVWNAVLLLDEADIFLECRNESDILRNAMVGVFLRLLEYHQGVLFLTTNRVKNIDPAFYSRISIGISFSESTYDKRRQIWNNLLAAASVNLAQEEIDTLANYNINGRQIKNSIRLAQSIAFEYSRPVNILDLIKIIDMAIAFESNIKQ